MNLVQTTLLALPAVITGFLGAFSFSSDSGSALKIAAIAGQTEFPAFTGEEILAKWKAEMAKRKTQNDEADQRRKKEATMNKNPPNFQLLTRKLEELRIDASTQKAVNNLNTQKWKDSVKALVAEINEFPKTLEGDMEGLKGNLANLEPEKQKPEVEDLAKRITNARTDLKDKRQPEWGEKLKSYLDEYKKQFPSPTSEK